MGCQGVCGWRQTARTIRPGDLASAVDEDEVGELLSLDYLQEDVNIIPTLPESND